MVERVDSDKIEGIVGVERHAVEHWARAVSEEQTVYILHSRHCLDQDIVGLRSLEDCYYSEALNQGIDVERWVEDVPVRVMVRFGRLEPYDPSVSDGGSET